MFILHTNELNQQPCIVPVRSLLPATLVRYNSSTVIPSFKHIKHQHTIKPSTAQHSTQAAAAAAKMKKIRRTTILLCGVTYIGMHSYILQQSTSTAFAPLHAAGLYTTADEKPRTSLSIITSSLLLLMQIIKINSGHHEKWCTLK